MAKKIKRKCKKRSCKAFPIKGSDYCFAHDPTRQAERKKEQARGGKTSMAPKTFAKADYELKTIPDVKLMLRDVTNAVLTGSLDINRGKAAMYGASIIISCIKEDDFEKRLKAIEDQLTNKKGN